MRSLQYHSFEAHNNRAMAPKANTVKGLALQDYNRAVNLNISTRKRHKSTGTLRMGGVRRLDSLSNAIELDPRAILIKQLDLGEAGQQGRGQWQVDQAIPESDHPKAFTTRAVTWAVSRPDGN